MRRQALPTLLVILVMGAVAALASAPRLGFAGDAAPASRRFQFTYQAIVRDVPAGARRAYLWLPLPPDTAEQSIRDLAIDTTHRHRVVTERRYGNHVLRVELAPGAAEQQVVLRFEATRSERRNRQADTTPAAEAQPASKPAKWLDGDRRVPIDGKVAEWARETAGNRPPAAAARVIYDYVVTNLKYDKSGTGWGNGDIYWACDARRGNCTDFHAVFTGYARALGIPARFEIGFPIPPSRGEGEIAGYHCWAQFHLEDRGWVPVDASEAAKHADQREYFFGAHDENRVLFTVGRDLVLPGMKSEPLNYFIYPYAEVDGKPHAAIEKRVSWKDIQPYAAAQSCSARQQPMARAGPGSSRADSAEGPGRRRPPPRRPGRS